MTEILDPAEVWPVGALCHAVGQALESRFNPVWVQGEVSGFSRASSGHCYLSLKDARGQLRCAMFRRAAVSLDFEPQDGEQVQVHARLGVYEPRGELQLIIESMSRVGRGALFEQFLRSKAKLEAEGLFDASRKRAWPVMPRAIGLVTSLGAAALHDFVTTLVRRAPHVRVVLAPSVVQGAQAPNELIQALRSLYANTSLDGIVIVRGGGSLEDLWAFNDEALVRTVANSPVPTLVGIGHETDFSLVDFCADLRAPTPTAAAEWVTQDRAVWLSALDGIADKLNAAARRPLDTQQQRLDTLTARLSRPNALVARQRAQLALLAQALRHGVSKGLGELTAAQTQLSVAHRRAVQSCIDTQRQRLDRAALRLEAVNPELVLQRGYAWVTEEGTDPGGHGQRAKALTRVGQTRVGRQLTVRLADGQLGVKVTAIAPTPTQDSAQVALI